MITAPLVEGVPLAENVQIIEQETMTLKESKIFIFKVYMCLLFQLCTALGFILISDFYNIKSFYISDLGLAFTCLSIYFTLIPIFVSCCCERYFTIFPINYILLCLFTLGMSYILSFISSSVDENTLLLTLGITTIDTISMTFIGLLSFWEIYISYFNNFLVILFMSLISISFINIFTLSSYIHLLIACIGSILFSGYIIFDTKMITDRTYKIYKKDDFIIASIDIYVDILNLFIYLLQILSFSDNTS